jgi:pimeloyl-ACP methyl ester carboxylesterase
MHRHRGRMASRASLQLSADDRPSGTTGISIGRSGSTSPTATPNVPAAVVDALLTPAVHTDLLARIQAPTLLVAGSDDLCGRRQAPLPRPRTWPHGQAVTIAGTRHLPALEAPEEVIGLIAKFWAATSSDGTRAEAGTAS